jgi:hypothetical protein
MIYISSRTMTNVTSHETYVKHKNISSCVSNLLKNTILENTCPSIPFYGKYNTKYLEKTLPINYQQKHEHNPCTSINTE